MEAAQILAQTSTEEGMPQDWLVFPLLRQKVITGIVGWIFGAVVGGLLFVFMAPIMVPHNYQNGVVSAILTTLILGAVLYVCLGSIWAMVVDILRISHPDKHIIIITPEDFVKQEGKKTIHVPLQYIKYVTARGTPPVDRSLEAARADTNTRSIGMGIGGLFLGQRAVDSTRKGGFGRRRLRTPSTLAFIDSRTNREVVVVNDKAYGEPHHIAAQLKEYAEIAAEKMEIH